MRVRGGADIRRPPQKGYNVSRAADNPNNLDARFESNAKVS
jgi:hypothetical protein